MMAKKSKSESESSSKAHVIDNVARHMISKRVYPIANTPFPEDYIVTEPEPGETAIYRVLNEDKVVERVKFQHVVNSVIKWCAENWLAQPDLLIEPDMGVKIAKNWLARCDKTPGFAKPFEFEGGDNYCIQRVPFRPDLDADFSHVNINQQEWKKKHPFIEFLSRCSSPDQLAAFIGSIFYEKSYMQQYLNIWGEGNDGKGSLLRALEKILGSAYHADSFEFMGRFWTSAFIGKRLIAFPDNNDQKAMQSGMWKQLTGGDSVRIEFKNEFSCTARLNAKYVITSNFAPVLKMDKADLRRAIVVAISPIQGEIDAEVDRRMQEWDQLQFMVEFCCWKYRTMCPNHEPIQVKSDQIEQIHNADEELEQKIIANFSFSPSCVLSANEIRKSLALDYHAGKVARILTKRFGCVKFQARPVGVGRGGVKNIYYAGIGINGDTEKRNIICLNEVKGLDVYERALAKIVGTDGCMGTDVGTD